MQLRDCRAVGGMETAHLQAAVESPDHQLHLPLRWRGKVLAEPVASAMPGSIVQNVSGDLLDGGAEPYHLSPGLEASTLPRR
eukprot:2421160-Prymnesium_polylepis.2